MKLNPSHIWLYRFQFSQGLALGIVMVLSLGLPAIASDPGEDEILGVAINGYDTVAYFTVGKAVKGTSEFVYYWNEAEWHFSSRENRDRFAADPEAYAPNHSGF